MAQIMAGRFTAPETPTAISPPARATIAQDTTQQTEARGNRGLAEPTNASLNNPVFATFAAGLAFAGLALASLALAGLAWGVGALVAGLALGGAALGAGALGAAAFGLAIFSGFSAAAGLDLGIAASGAR